LFYEKLIGFSVEQTLVRLCYARNGLKSVL
jgi:hypothetical protein